MDVLEHTDDDIAVLQNTVEHCQSGGYLFITVPALQFLWSKHDEFLGHRRRYSLRSLRKLITNCQELEIMHMHYFFASILPIAGIVRLAKRWLGRANKSDMMPAGRITNWILLKILTFELNWSLRNHFAGLSAVAVCRKK
jgi:hypothetical protein